MIIIRRTQECHGIYYLGRKRFPIIINLLRKLGSGVNSHRPLAVGFHPPPDPCGILFLEEVSSLSHCCNKPTNFTTPLYINPYFRLQ